MLRIIPEKRKNRFIVLAILLTILLMESIWVFDVNIPGITGFVVYDEKLQLNLNKTYYSNDYEILDINSEISSLSLNTKLIGDGTAVIWLETNGTRILIANLTQRQISENLITGLVTEEVEKQDDSIYIGDPVEESDPEPIINESVIEIIENNTEITINTTQIIDNKTEIIDNTTEIIVNLTENITSEITINVTENMTYNETYNGNVTYNITINLTDNVTYNFTYNLTYNITDNITYNITFNDSISNTTIEINITNQTQSITSFSDICENTCNLANTTPPYKLVIELSNASLLIESINYELKPQSIIQIRPLPNIKLNRYNNSTIINLSEYFNSSKELSFDINYIDPADLNVAIDGHLLYLNMNNYSESKIIEAYVYATDGDTLLTSNTFTIDINNSLENMTNLTTNLTTNITIDTIQYPARLNEKVRWIKNVRSLGEQANNTLAEINIPLPDTAENITITKVSKIKNDVGENIREKIKHEFKNRKTEIQKNKGIPEVRITEETAEQNNENISIEINNTLENIEIEYYTAPPTSSERNFSKNKKQVIISSDMHYTNVTSFSDLPTEVSDKKFIKLKWKINNSQNITGLNLSDEEIEIINNNGSIQKDMSFDAYDNNDNGLIDHIEWVAPHLSNQVFNIIIITKADLLDENRTYIESIYEYVKEQDDVWFNVSMNNYVRVTFEKNLTSANDITIYARAQSEDAIVRVYEEGQNEIIAEFNNLTEEKYYKVYLNLLNDSQDTFDLEILGGSIMIDHITDPAYETETARTGLVMYSTGDAEDKVAYRFWNKTDFESEMNLSATILQGSEVQWVLARASTTRDQVAVAVIDDDGDILLNAYNTTADTWGTWLDVANLGRTNDAYRAVGMEVEQESGDFLVVYENISSNNRLLYSRTFNGTAWSSESTITLDGAVASEPQLVVRLENAPSGDEILMATAGGSDDLSVARWNGTAWVNITVVTLDAAAVDEERFSIAYERQSHDAMLAWGNATAANYMILDNTTKTWGAQSQIRDRGAVVAQITLCADPNSDYIGAAIGPDSLSDLLFVMWNGTAWLSGEPAEETGIEDVTTVNAYCSWTTSSNVSLFTFVNADSLNISYLTYNRNSNNWTCPENGQNVTNLTQIEGSNGPCNSGTINMSDDIETLRSARDRDSNNIMLWGVDLLYNAEAFIFNGTLITQPSSGTLEPYSGWPISTTLFTETTYYTYYNHPSAATSSGAVFYGEFTNGTQKLKYKIFDGNDFGEEKEAPDLGLGAAIQYIILEPSTKFNQTVAVINDDDGDIWTNVYDGATGTWLGWTFMSEVGTSYDTFQVFDIAAEPDTGDIILVYERYQQNTMADRNLYYRIWNSSTWSDEGVITYISPAVAEPQRVIRLQNAPTGEEMILAFDGAGDDLSVIRWNGTAWVNATVITTIGANVDEESFAIAYQRDTHDVMLAWGSTGNMLNYSIMNNITKVWSQKGMVRDRGAVVNQVTLCANPNSGHIGAAIGPDGGSDVLFVMWNGTAWLDGEPAEESGVEDVAVTNVYCSWTSFSNISLFTFVDNGALNFSYVTYNISTGNWTCSENGQNVTSLENAEGANGPCNTGTIMSDDIEVLRHIRDPDNNNIMLWGNDLAEDIEMFIFNGTHITQPPTALLETVTTTSSAVEPVWFVYNKYAGLEQDNTYPQFSSFNDNNATLYGAGTGIFNVTVINTNGTVWLEIDGTNITATNISGNTYNATYEFSANGTYIYRWHSWGNGTSNNYNHSEDRAYYVNDVISDQQPTITTITSILNVDPIEADMQTIAINFTVNDADGNSTINISSAIVIVNNSGITRTSIGCSGFAINATAQNISCNVSMQYYDPFGIWSINISVKDNDNNYVENTTTTFTYNELSAIQINTNNVDVGTVDIAQQDIALTPIIINNTGNSLFVNLSIKAYDLINSTYLISPTNFNVNVSDASSGQSLINNTFINITDSILMRNNDTASFNKTLYIYLDVPSAPLTAGYYRSISEWIILANK